MKTKQPKPKKIHKSISFGSVADYERVRTRLLQLAETHQDRTGGNPPVLIRMLADDYNQTMDTITQKLPIDKDNAPLFVYRGRLTAPQYCVRVTVDQWDRLVQLADKYTEGNVGRLIAIFASGELTKIWKEEQKDARLS